MDSQPARQSGHFGIAAARSPETRATQAALGRDGTPSRAQPAHSADMEIAPRDRRVLFHRRFLSAIQLVDRRPCLTPAVRSQGVTSATGLAAARGSAATPSLRVPAKA